MTPLWGALSSIYRMFLRVFRVRAILDSAVAVHPRRRLGGAGGPAAPFRGARGDTPLDYGYSVIYGPKWVLSPHFLRGVGGVPHKSLLDLLVRTDTKGVGRGFKGDPTVPLVCDFCSRPLRLCDCLPGRDY